MHIKKVLVHFQLFSMNVFSLHITICNKLCELLLRFDVLSFIFFLRSFCLAYVTNIYVQICKVFRYFYTDSKWIFFFHSDSIEALYIAVCSSICWNSESLLLLAIFIKFPYQYWKSDWLRENSISLHLTYKLSGWKCDLPFKKLCYKTSKQITEIIA